MAENKIKYSRWFSIDKDGQPQLSGWYDILYQGDKSSSALRYWWDGTNWKFSPQEGKSLFGNWATAGERWRGLAEVNVNQSSDGALGGKGVE